ncbi:unnamed protein product [Symbiodinium necroappetens]|uniref:Uncharacterized protein n=1 Tax=Symbiodinium necroappetens TaxID=1628268 RepID=A0A812QXB3_9DINO|nr:unnamed protein product [Symbiodinium necroappetens]
MRPHPPEDEQPCEFSAAVPDERVPALDDAVPHAEVNFPASSLVQPCTVTEEADPHRISVMASEESSADGRNSHESSEGEHSSTSSEKDVQANLGAEAGEVYLAQLIARMAAFCPDIIQAVHAYQAVKRFGHIFRAQKGASASHRRVSFETTKIDQFWSHSWHGPKWNKAMTAVYVNNGMMAALVAAPVSFLVMFLHAFRILPTLQLVRGIRFYPSHSYWVKVLCLVLYFVALFFWMPRQKIFLDVLCIDQGSARRKALGLASMGAFLRASDSLVILWDPSWSRRLWCVFELAAFLHSRQVDGRQVKLTIRPTLLGPCFISLPIALSFVMLAMSFIPDENVFPGADPDRLRYFILWPSIGLSIFIGFFFSIIKLRAYFRYVQALEQDIGKFVVNDGMSHCCSVGHVSAAGTQMVCDRRVILQCITTWFGSVEQFESHVRTDVLQCLQDQLSREVFTYKQIAVSALPMLWHYMDSAATMHYHYIGIGDRPLFGAIREFVRGLGWTFGVVPVVVLATVRLSYLLQRRRTFVVCDIMVNLSIMAITFLFVVAALMSEQWFWTMNLEGLEPGQLSPYELLPGSALFSIVMLSIALTQITIRYVARCSKCTFRRKAPVGHALND